MNLREPYYSSANLESSLGFATVLKMNDGEVPLVLDLLGMPHTDDTSPNALVSGGRALIDEFPLTLVCITMGSQGSLLIGRSQVDRHPGVRCEVADTVGAGDTFTAALAHYYLEGASLAVMNEAGNRWARGWHHSAAPCQSSKMRSAKPSRLSLVNAVRVPRPPADRTMKTEEVEHQENKAASHS